MLNVMLLTQLFAPQKTPDNISQAQTMQTGEPGVFLGMIGGMLGPAGESPTGQPAPAVLGSTAGVFLAEELLADLARGIPCTDKTISPLQNQMPNSLLPESGGPGPVMISVNLVASGMPESGLEALENAGIPIGPGDQPLTLLIEPQDIEALKAATGSMDKVVSEPVQMVLSLNGVSKLVPAVLTLVPPNNDNDLPEGLALTFDAAAPAIPAQVPDNAENSIDAAPSIPAGALIAKLSSALDRVLENSREESPITTDSAFLNKLLTVLGAEVPLNSEDSTTGGIQQALDSLLADLGLSGGNTVGCDGNPPSDKAGEGIQDALEVLAAILVLGGALAPFLEGEGKAVNIDSIVQEANSLLERISALDNLPSGERRSELESILTAARKIVSAVEIPIPSNSRENPATGPNSYMAQSGESGKGAVAPVESATGAPAGISGTMAPVEGATAMPQTDQAAGAQDVLRRIISSLRGNYSRPSTAEVVNAAPEPVIPVQDGPEAEREAGQVLRIAQSLLGLFESSGAAGAETGSLPSDIPAGKSEPVVPLAGEQLRVSNSPEPTAAARQAPAAAIPVETPHPEVDNIPNGVSGKETLAGDLSPEDRARHNGAAAHSRAGRTSEQAVESPKPVQSVNIPEKTVRPTETEKVTFQIEPASNPGSGERKVSGYQQQQAAFAYSGNTGSVRSGQTDNLSLNRPAAQADAPLNAQVESITTLLGDNKSGTEEGSDSGRQAMPQRLGQDTATTNLKSDTFALRMENVKTPETPATRTLELANQAEVAEKLSSAARLTASGGSSEIRLKLEPEQLGLMRVHLRVDENHGVTARIQVESQEARSLIESSLGRLRESMQEQGLRVDKFSVDVRQDQGQQNPQQQFAASGREDGYRERARNGAAGGSADGSGGEENDTDRLKVQAPRTYGNNTLEWVA